MEIPAWVYLSTWALIGFTFLHLGFNALDSTAGLSVSVHPLVMSFFKHSLAISACHSSTYTLIFRQHVKLSILQRYSWLIFGSLPCVLYQRRINTMFLWGSMFSVLIPSFCLDLILFQQLRSLLLVLFVSFLTSSYWAELSGLHPYTRYSRSLLLTDKESMKLLADEQLPDDRILIESVQRLLASESYQELLADEEVLADERIRRLAADERFHHLIPAAAPPDETYQELLRMAEKLKEKFMRLKETAVGKWVEFAIGMVGTVLFQNFFKLTTFDHVVSFLYIVVAWVANIALVGNGGGSGDLGVFNFLLGNVIVGYTVSQFGVGGTTWIAYGVSVSLFGLRLKLDSLRFVDREGEQTKVVLW